MAPTSRSSSCSWAIASSRRPTTTCPVGAWGDYEELDEVVRDIYHQREAAQDRTVVIEG